MRMIGIPQWRSRTLRNTFPQAMARPFVALFKVPVSLTAFYYLITFAWVVGINTTLAIFLTPLYNFGPKQIGKYSLSSGDILGYAITLSTLIGFFYFTPIVAAIIGETIGHWLHDFVAREYMKRHDNHLKPEARLTVIWFSTPFMLAGLVLLGFALERAYHYMVCSLGWGLYVFGIMITTVGVNAYVLDSYPEVSTLWMADLYLPSPKESHILMSILNRHLGKLLPGLTLHARLVVSSYHISRYSKRIPLGGITNYLYKGHLGECKGHRRVLGCASCDLLYWLHFDHPSSGVWREA
jgi:hypothetical protein